MLRFAHIPISGRISLANRMWTDKLDLSWFKFQKNSHNFCLFTFNSQLILNMPTHQIHVFWYIRLSTWNILMSLCKFSKTFWKIIECRKFEWSSIKVFWQKLFSQNFEEFSISRGNAGSVLIHILVEFSQNFNFWNSKKKTETWWLFYVCVWSLKCPHTTPWRKSTYFCLVHKQFSSDGVWENVFSRTLKKDFWLNVFWNTVKIF